MNKEPHHFDGAGAAEDAISTVASPVRLDPDLDP
jgi:hypothetical protein